MVRKEKGIRQESEVDPLNCLTKEERRKAIRNEHAKREKIWLDKLRHLNIWPVLFVCGAEHVNPFCELLKKERLTPKVVCGDWSPKGTDPW
ncbi:MAG: hypothetical protein ACE5JJ_04180 [Nitrospinota bacterium]